MDCTINNENRINKEKVEYGFGIASVIFGILCGVSAYIFARLFLVGIFLIPLIPLIAIAFFILSFSFGICGLATKNKNGVLIALSIIGLCIALGSAASCIFDIGCQIEAFGTIRLM